jgi:hypothetical protein
MSSYTEKINEDLKNGSSFSYFSFFDPKIAEQVTKVGRANMNKLNNILKIKKVIN